ncbi:MAG: polymer-forming cytoskeletal protein [Alphaproteobacteria bacterium]
MFRRKKPENDEIKSVGDYGAGDGVTGDEDVTAPPMKPFSKRGTHAPMIPVVTPRADIPRRPSVELPGAPKRFDRQPEHEGKKLIVGRDIELTGEINACDRLVVEGKVTADLTDAGVIEVAQTGVFRGSAEVDDAEISGLFDGALTVRRKLVVRGSGRIRGTLRYACLVIELGGEIQGTVEVIPPAPAPTSEAEAVRQLASPMHADGSFGLGERETG